MGQIAVRHGEVLGWVRERTIDSPNFCVTSGMRQVVTGSPLTCFDHVGYLSCSFFLIFWNLSVAGFLALIGTIFLSLRVAT